tara:strand:+ start:29 stop:961 length:933 start_codon:yes stop_codon:yes gene_type:complete
VKILITGGAGYIGSVLSLKLLESGYNVTVIDNFMYRQNSLLDCCRYTNFSVIRGDCRDKRLIEPSLKSCDIIIPLAALVGAPLCEQMKEDAVSINYEAIQSLCKWSSKSQIILLPTTNSGYGIGQKGRFCDENSPLDPISLYGTTKVNAEKCILDRGNSISFRLATVFGSSPRMRTDLLVNDFVHRAINDKAIIIFEGHFKRNYIHVRDVADIFLHGINHFDEMNGEPYNVGLANANLSKIELCEKIRKLIPNFIWIEAPIGQDPDKRDYIVSNEKIYSTGFKPNWSIENGIRELIKTFIIIRNNSYSNV